MYGGASSSDAHGFPDRDATWKIMQLQDPWTRSLGSCLGIRKRMCADVRDRSFRVQLSGARRPDVRHSPPPSAPLGLSQHRLAVAIGVPPRRINEIVHGKRRVPADTALRLSRYFGTSERFWMNLQGRYDLEIERDRLSMVLKEITPLVRARPIQASSGA